MNNRRTVDSRPFNRREVPPTLLGRAEVITQGYEGQNVPEDFSIPSANIEDVDIALFNFFNVSLNMQVNYRNRTRNVPVVFSGGERYAMTKSDRPIRDKSGAIITPIIAIHRTNIVQGSDPALAFGTDTGDLVIRRRLDPSDREYQQVVNRFNLQNQDNVAGLRNSLENSTSPRVSSRRRRGGTSLQTALTNPLDDNIYEIIAVPTPNFITLKYTVTFWSSYVVEMNQMIERFIAGQDIGSTGAVNAARIESNKGYWYVAFFDEDIAMDNNFTDYTTQQKMVKSTINIRVPAYTFATMGPGDPSPFRKFISAPTLEFDVCELDATVERMNVQMPMLGPEDVAFVRSDVERVPIDGRMPDVGDEGLATRDYIFNPFATSQAQNNPRFSRIVYRTSKGEKVGRTTDAIILERITRP